MLLDNKYLILSPKKVDFRWLALSNMSQIADLGWWMDAMMVWPRSARLDMCSITFSAAKLSSPTRQNQLNPSKPHIKALARQAIHRA